MRGNIIEQTFFVIVVPVWLLLTTVASFKFYPLFAAIGNSSPIVGTATGIVYSGYL